MQVEKKSIKNEQYGIFKDTIIINVIFKKIDLGCPLCTSLSKHRTIDQPMMVSLGSEKNFLVTSFQITYTAFSTACTNINRN